LIEAGLAIASQNEFFIQPPVESLNWHTGIQATSETSESNTQLSGNGIRLLAEVVCTARIQKKMIALRRDPEAIVQSGRRSKAAMLAILQVKASANLHKWRKKRASNLW
jgi:hypothetical protein